MAIQVTAEEENEAQQLASQMFSKNATFATYSQYTSNENVRQRLRELWTKSGVWDVKYARQYLSKPTVEQKAKTFADVMQEAQGKQFAKITQSKVPSSTDVFLGTKKVAGNYYKVYQEPTTNKIFYGGQASGEIAELLKTKGTTYQSSTPTSKDILVGVEKVGEQNYDIYKTPQGKKFIGGETQARIYQEQVSTYKGVPIMKTYVRDEEGNVREATSEEYKYYKQQKGNVLQGGNIYQTENVASTQQPQQFVQMGQSILPELKGMWEESGISNLLNMEISLPSFILPGKSITVREFKGYAKEFGLGGQILGSIPFPETVGQALVLEASVVLFPILPEVIQIGVGGYTSVTGIAGAFNPKATTGERIVSGTIGTLAGVGTVFEALPFIKGQFAKLSPKYAKVTTQPEGFQAIQLEETRIGLIPEKSPLNAGLTLDVELPSTSPLKKGGFGFTLSQEKLFVSETPQFLTTSFQSTLLKEGLNIPIERQLFATPQELSLGIPETRISRLGLSDLFKLNLDTSIGFGIPESPQIILTKAKVGLTETATGFQMQTYSSELQATKSYGTITDITKLGVTTIKGQAVNIYGYNVGKGIGTGNIISTSKFSSIISPRVSGELTLSTTLSLLKTQPVTFKTTQTMPTYVVTGKYKPSVNISPYKTTTTYKPSISKSILKISIPNRTTKKIAGYNYQVTQKRKPFYYPPTSRKSFQVSKQFKGMKISSGKLFKQPSGSFSVYVRRGGKFSLLGAGLSLPKAFSLGTGKVKKTLAATFLVKQQRGTYRGRTPKGFYAKPTKLGTLYIEKRSQRIKKRGVSLELPELKYYKSMKGGRR